MAGFFLRACRRGARLSAKAFAFAVVSAVLVAAAGATAPAPQWLPPHDLSQSGADAVIPDIVVDTKGDTTVVWAQAKDSVWTVQAVDRPSGGSWSAPVAISSPANAVAAPQVATAGPYVTAAWTRLDDKSKNEIVQAADRDPKTNAWSTPTSLSAPGRDAQQQQLAVNAAGDTVAVWSTFSLTGWTVQAAYRSHGGAWAPAVPLDAATIATAYPDVVIDGSGRAVAAWGEQSGAGWRVYASSRATDGTWSKAVAISGPDAAGTIAPQLALEGSNDVLAVWSRVIGTSRVIESSTRSFATGAWSPAAALFPPGPDAIAPVVAVDKRGDGVIVWTRSDPSSTGLSVVAAVRRPAKAWGRPLVLATAKTGALAPEVAIDARGDIVVVWQYSTGGFSRVQASSLAAGSATWSAPRRLSRLGADAVTPQVALDTAGDGAVAWARVAGPSFVIQGDGYDANGPELNKLSIPLSGVAGKKVSFAVTPIDVWAAIRTIRWSFGDGTAGNGRLTGHVYKRPGRYQASVTAADAFGHLRTVKRWIRILAA